MAPTNTSKERRATIPMAHNNGLLGASRIEADQAPLQFAEKPRTVSIAKSELENRVANPIPIRLKRGRQATPVTVADTSRKQNAKRTAASNARDQFLLHADASSPAASAQQIELKFASTDNAASFHPTPPIRKGMVSTGRTATHNVKARNP